MNWKKKHSSAFTLIELCIVFVIIGVLVGVSFPSYIYVIERARAMEAISMLRALKMLQIANDMGNNSFSTDINASVLVPDDDISHFNYAFSQKVTQFFPHEIAITAKRTTLNAPEFIIGKQIQMNLYKVAENSDYHVYWGPTRMDRPSQADKDLFMMATTEVKEDVIEVVMADVIEEYIEEVVIGKDGEIVAEKDEEIVAEIKAEKTDSRNKKPPLKPLAPGTPLDGYFFGRQESIRLTKDTIDPETSEKLRRFIKQQSRDQLNKE